MPNPQNTKIKSINIAYMLATVTKTANCKLVSHLITVNRDRGTINKRDMD